jgi:Cu+-exporting ATPase
MLEERGMPLGAAAALVEAQELAGRTATIVAVQGEIAGVLGIADEVKPNAARAVAALKQLGLRIIMMTGDNERVAAAVAARTGVDEARAGARPEDKLALVRALQAEGRMVAMVGDGINDAPALAQADIGIAMSTGTDVAMEAADITLLHGDISKVAEAILLGRATLKTIRQNLGWAFGYNILMIPIAAAGLLNPILAGAAMAFSSVSVMANSLRLRSQARAIARDAGNSYSGGNSVFRTNRGPFVSLGAGAAVLLVPFLVFTAIDRGWFSDDSIGEREVRVTLENWHIGTSRDSINAGEVAFTAVHPETHDHGDGAGQVHDLAIFREEPDGTLSLVAKTPAIAMGDSSTLTVDLAAGSYELECTVAEEVDGTTVVHLAKGMRASFTVS